MSRRSFRPSLASACLLALVLAPLAAAQSNSTGANDDYLPVGSTPNRLSLPSLLFSLPLLVLGLYFLLLPLLVPLLTTSLALANFFALGAWVGTANLQAPSGLTGGTEWADCMAIWGIVCGFALLGLALGATSKYGFWAGWVFVGPGGGLAFAFALMLIGNDMTMQSLAVRWVVIALLVVFGLMLVAMTRIRGVIVCAPLIGAFLLCLGIDLLVNEKRGMSKGLAYLMVHPSNHPQGLETYRPPASTRVLAVGVWILAIIAAAVQFMFFRKRNFAPYATTPAYAGRPRSLENEADPEAGPYDRQASATPGVGELARSTGEIAEAPNRAATREGPRASASMLGVPGSNRLRKGAVANGSGGPRVESGTTASESGLSAIAELTERSRTDSGHGAGSVGPHTSSMGAFAVERGGRVGGADPFAENGVYETQPRQVYHGGATTEAGHGNELYHTEYASDFDPYASVVHQPASQPQSHASAPDGEAARLGWEDRFGLANPYEPATPPATVFSDSTLLPEDSASQVGWRRFQAEQRAQEQQQQVMHGFPPVVPTEVQSGVTSEGTREVPIVITAATAPQGPLRVTNADPMSSTTGSPTAGSDPPRAQAAASPPPSPLRSDTAASSGSDGSPLQASGIGRPLRVFWRPRRPDPPAAGPSGGDTGAPPEPNGTTTAATPSPDHAPVALEAAGPATAAGPETPAAAGEGASHVTPSARGVFNRLAEAFASSRGGSGAGRAGAGGGGSTAMTAPTGSLAPFLTHHPPLAPEASSASGGDGQGADLGHGAR